MVWSDSMFLKCKQNPQWTMFQKLYNWYILSPVWDIQFVLQRESNNNAIVRLKLLREHDQEIVLDRSVRYQWMQHLYRSRGLLSLIKAVYDLSATCSTCATILRKKKLLEERMWYTGHGKDKCRESTKQICDGYCSGFEISTNKHSACRLWSCTLPRTSSRLGPSLSR